MKMGLMLDAGDGGLDGLVKAAQRAEASGFDNLWMANIFGFDAITSLAIIGRATESIGLGSAVVPTYPRHPSAIAQQAVTAAAASNGRFTLGIGLSHKIVIEDMLGFSYEKPARHMREYLEVLVPLMAGETTNFDGNEYRVHNLTISAPGVDRVPLLIAALGPAMLRLAGERTDGTVTWMTGPKTLETHIAPSIGRAAQSAGRPAPRVAAGFPVVLTNDPAGAREMIGKSLQIYGMLPSYRAMLDREGVAGPAELAFAGSEAELTRNIDRLRNIGVTDFCASIVASDAAEYQRTFEFLASLL